jgi:hypothetical protein
MRLKRIDRAQRAIKARRAGASHVKQLVQRNRLAREIRLLRRIMEILNESF